MLNLALIGLSASSLERRIGEMQRSSSLPRGIGALAILASGSLVLLACAAHPPGERPRAVPPSSGAEAPLAPSRHAQVDPTEGHLQDAATRYYGDLAPNTTGDRRLLWFVFHHDWTVQRHDIGVGDVVEVEDADVARVYGDRKPVPRPWSVNASLAKKFPDLEGLGTKEGQANISDLGGGIAVIAHDTVSVFWARYAQ
jgi:hypothetical protein